VHPIAEAKFRESDTAVNPSTTLFVYGSLKRGFWNHREFLGSAGFLGSGHVWGRLYDLPGGFPAIEIPEESILAYGTSDHLADAGMRHDRGCNPDFPENLEGDWSKVHGEVYGLQDPGDDLRDLDVLEGFRSQSPSFYQRVLVRVQLESHAQPAWVYVSPAPMEGILLSNGTWTG